MERPHVLFLCTGNAARSVMAGMMLSQRSQAFEVTTAGTHVIEGHPMSWRTRDAIVGTGFTVEHHRSRQITDQLGAGADLVVAMAGEHVAYMRRRNERLASRTGTLKRLCRELPDTEGTFSQRVAALGLATVELEPWEDVEDPAGGELPEFLACAEIISGLIDEFVATLTTSPAPLT
jgi:protein-tyrosine-phosphatase